MIKFKKLLTVITASLMALILAFSFGCTPQNSGGNEDEWVVTLDYNDAEVVNDVVVKAPSRPRKVYVEKESSMAAPATPTRTGYQLDKWTDSKDGGNTVTFPYTPTSDVTLYAQWTAKSYGVSFEYNFAGAPAAETMDAQHGDEIDNPFDTVVKSKLTVDGEYYTHTGNPGYFTRGEWMTQATGGTKVSFPYTVLREDIHFYLRWYANGTEFYHITFDANYPDSSDNDMEDDIEVVEGESLTSNLLPKPNSVEGFSFKGWTTDPSSTDVIPSPWTPTESTKLYGVWTKADYTVRFVYNYVGNPDGGLKDTVHKAVAASAGDVIEEAPELTREQQGFKFTLEGWYNNAHYNAKGATKIEFPYTVTGNVRLYAHWVADPIEADTFDAEFAVFDPDFTFLGYSGSAQGVGAIAYDLSGAHSIPYPILGGANSDQNAQTPHYVSYLFSPNATLTFNIYSDKAVSNVTLKAALSTEFVQRLTISPSNENAYLFKVNGTSLNYSAITIDGGANAAGDMYKGSVFSEYTVSTSVSLNEGWNTIELVTNNQNRAFGGTTGATAPTVDYIKLTASGAKLSWSPSFDNLYDK